MTDRDDDSLMLAYVYGELSESEVSAFEARLAEDPGLRAEVDGLLATRELLGEDARYGERAGVDLPPPHLTEAILRAEVLARPDEIRQAHARQGQSWLSRMSTWLVGGGLAVTAAAAFLLVATDGAEPEADLLKAPSPPGSALEEAAGDGRPAAEPTASRPLQSDKKGARSDHLARPKSETLAETGALGNLADEPAPMELGAGDADAFAPLDTRAQAPASDEEAEASRQEQKRGAKPDVEGAAFGGLRRDAPLEERAEEDVGVADDALAAGERANAPTAAPSTAAPQKRPPEERPARSAAKPSAPHGGSAGASRSPPAPPAAPQAGPPPLPSVVKEQLYKAKKRATSPGREAAEKQSPAHAGRAQLRQELELSLFTAENELTEGRAIDALDLFTSVARRDPRGAIVGVAPYVGQMRAMYALGRHREVIALVPTVRRPGIHAPTVADGLLTAARSAEAVGDLRLARELYRELLVVKDKRKLAEEGLSRVGDERRLRQKATAAEAESAASDAAAAAPAE